MLVYVFVLADSLGGATVQLLVELVTQTLALHVVSRCSLCRLWALAD